VVAIVGIVCGAVVVIALIGVGIWWIAVHRRRVEMDIGSTGSLAPDHLLDPRVAGYPDQARSWTGNDSASSHSQVI
jgi:hypothetical protein